jgi:hypothetical protein
MNMDHGERSRGRLAAPIIGAVRSCAETALEAQLAKAVNPVALRQPLLTPTRFSWSITHHAPRFLTKLIEKSPAALHPDALWHKRLVAFIMPGGR